MDELTVSLDLLLRGVEKNACVFVDMATERANASTSLMESILRCLTERPIAEWSEKSWSCLVALCDMSEHLCVQDTAPYEQCL